VRGSGVHAVVAADVVDAGLEGGREILVAIGEGSVASECLLHGFERAIDAGGFVAEFVIGGGVVDGFEDRGESCASVGDPAIGGGDRAVQALDAGEEFVE